MNIFKNLLFLQGYPTDTHDHDEALPLLGHAGDAFAPYGNRVASERFFGKLGHHQAAAAPAEARQLANACVAGGCG